MMLKYILTLLVLVCNESHASSVILHDKDAIVWHPEQIITGEVSGITVKQVTVHYSDSSFSVPIDQNHFSFQVVLRDKNNKIWIEASHNNSIVVSDTLNYTLRYNPSPIIKPTAGIMGDKAVLKANTIENPFNKPIKYLWVSDKHNPVQSEIKNSRDSVATVKIPDEPGNYFFNLLAITGKDTTVFQTMVSRKHDGLHAFDIDSDAAHWMDEAIIYEITPYNFVEDGTLKDITAKLPELKELGINTIWLQPVTKSYYNGQRYDVTDYLSVDPELGTGKELQNLVKIAKKLGLRVLFDVVLNHTSIQHPYAKDVIKNGVESPYYDYFQHEKDKKPYSSVYDMNEEGFTTYFWEDLVNLNYKNKEVRRWMLEVCKYWVRKYDIDGYRFDAIWGVNARRPSFAGRLRTELKSIKPDILLLAEDKGSVPQVFELGFDAAYDWTADTSWVSQWSWEYEYNHEKNLTIFNFPDADERGEMLKQALFNNNGNSHRLLRYIGNNDLPHFIQDHSLEQTKMAAALLFSLPGIPMIYNGQEIGKHGHPYSIDSVFLRDSTIKSLDREGLFSYYRRIIRTRKQHEALTSTNIDEIPIFPEENLVGFRRWKDGENFIVIINMDSTYADANIGIQSIADMNSVTKGYQLQDILSENTFEVKQDPSRVKIGMEGYSVRWLLLKDE